MEYTAKNKLRKVNYAAIDFATGLTDFVVTVRKPDGSLLDPAPTVTEQGDGVYEFSYTPDVKGLWQERIASATNGDKSYRSVQVGNNDTDDVKTAVDTVDGKVDTVDGKVDSVQTSVTTVDGKVDTLSTDVAAVDGKVDGVQSSVDTVDGKVDSLDTKATSIENKIDSIDGQIKPGGYLM